MRIPHLSVDIDRKHIIICFLLNLILVVWTFYLTDKLIITCIQQRYHVEAECFQQLFSPKSWSIYKSEKLTLSVIWNFRVIVVVIPYLYLFTISCFHWVSINSVTHCFSAYFLNDYKYKYNDEIGKIEVSVIKFKFEPNSSDKKIKK